VAGGAALFAARGPLLRRMAPVRATVPTYEVHRVPFVRRVGAEGNLRAVKADPVTAPLLDEPLKIAWMAPDGSAVKKGDVVVRFDPTEFAKKLKDGQSDHATAEAKIEKERTETGALLRDRDRTVTLSDAELEKSRKFPSKDTLIFSRNQIIESQVDEQLSTDRKSHAERAQALEGSLSKSKIDLLTIEQRKADIAIARASKGLSSLEVTAAHDGIIVFDQDWAGELPKVGDTKWSGQRIATLPLLDEMEVEAFVLEADAGGLVPGLPAKVALEADPGTVYDAKIKEVDSLAKPRIRDVPINYFSVILSLDRTDKTRMKPGQRAHVTLMLDGQDALAIPRQAVFEKEGRQVVYVGSNFEETAVKLGASSPGLVVVETGLRDGDRIALRDPTRPVEAARDNGAPKGTP
jgi:multidrug efflux pump subunit AcrA (membrane-fusion protein)